MPSPADAQSRTYAAATMRSSNRCCTGPQYSGGNGCGYQYGTVGRPRSPRDLSPSGLVRQQAAHLSSTGSPPKGSSNNMCLLQYDSNPANTLPRCGSANVICAGQNHYGTGGGHDEQLATGYSGGHAAPRRISSSCIRESTALVCCPSAPYSNHAGLGGIKNTAATTSSAASTTTSVAVAPAATPLAANLTSGNNNYSSSQNAHCPPAQLNNVSWLVVYVLPTCLTFYFA